MELIKCSIDNCNLKNNGLVATIGQFDGIHIAHQILIEKVCELSEEKELKSLDIDISEFEFPDLGETLDISDDDFYTDETVKNVKVKSIKCPHCGQTFEL